MGAKIGERNELRVENRELRVLEDWKGWLIFLKCKMANVIGGMLKKRGEMGCKIV